MSPFWNVIHDKGEFTFPGNCLEMVEQPVLSSRVIVWRSCDNRVCTEVLGILGKSQDILETRVRDTGQYRDSTIRLVNNRFDNLLPFFPTNCFNALLRDSMMKIPFARSVLCTTGLGALNLSTLRKSIPTARTLFETR